MKVLSLTLMFAGAMVTTLLLANPALAAPRWFQVGSSSWFTGWRRQVTELVMSEGAPPLNRPCIVGWQDGGLNTLHAYVYWPEKHLMITWIPSSDDPHSLKNSTRRLDLRRDVVATERAVGSSTYLVTRAWVRNVARQCRLHGTTMTIYHKGADHG